MISTKSMMLLIASAAAIMAQNVSMPSLILNHPVVEQLVSTNKAISPRIVNSLSVLPQGVLVHPGDSFSIGFVGDTFLMTDDSDLTYSGKLANGSPLPHWINFNKKEYTFDGVAPPSRQGAYAFELALHAKGSHHEAGVQLFNLTVAPHELYAVSALLPPVNVTRASSFFVRVSDVVVPYLRLDDGELKQEDVRKLSMELVSPSWVSYDKSAGSLSGVLPATSSNPPTEIVMRVHDTFNDNTFNCSFNVRVPISEVSSFFTAPMIPAGVLHPGPFSVDYSSFISNSTTPGSPALLSISLEPRDSSSWVQFDNRTNLLHGQVPDVPRSNHLNVTIIAFLPSTSTTSTTSQYFAIDTSVVRTSGGSSSETEPHSALSSRAKSAIAAVVAIFGGGILLCCILAFLRRAYGSGCDQGIRPGPAQYIISHDGPGWARGEKAGGPSQGWQSPVLSGGNMESQVSPHVAARYATQASIYSEAAPHSPTSPTMPKHKFFEKLGVGRPSGPPSRAYLSSVYAQPRQASGNSIRDAITGIVHSIKRTKYSDLPISKPVPIQTPPNQHSPTLSIQDSSRADPSAVLSSFGSSSRMNRSDGIRPGNATYDSNSSLVAGPSGVRRGSSQRTRRESNPFADHNSDTNLRDAYLNQFPESVSSNMSHGSRSDEGHIPVDSSEEGIIQKAVSVSVKDRTSSPQLRNAKLGDGGSSSVMETDSMSMTPDRVVGLAVAKPVKPSISGQSQAESTTLLRRGAFNNPSGEFQNGSGTISERSTSTRGTAAAAIVRSHKAHRPVQESTHGNDLNRNVSTRGEIGRTTNKGFGSNESLRH